MYGIIYQNVLGKVCEYIKKYKNIYLNQSFDTVNNYVLEAHRKKLHQDN